MTDFDTMPGDDFFIDFTGIQAKTFDPVPTGWYLYEIKGYDQTATKRDGKTMKAGTPGLNVDFIVADGPFMGRHVFQNFWLTADQQGYLKALMEKLPCYSEAEVNGKMDRALIDRMVGQKVWGRTQMKAGVGEYGPSNQIQSWRLESDPPKQAGGEASGAASMLP